LRNLEIHERSLGVVGEYGGRNVVVVLTSREDERMSKLKVVALAGVSLVALLFPAAESLAQAAPAPTPSPCPPGQHHSGTTCVKNTPPKPIKRTPTCAKGFHRSVIPPHRCVRNRSRPKPMPTHTP
jgi:hypothetical protein